MAADAYWRKGNTRPAAIITLNLGVDPQTQTPRTLQDGDVVTQIMRNTVSGSAAIVRTLEILDAATNKVRYKPAVGDLDEVGSPQVEFDITDSNDDVETLPDQAADNYVYQIDAKLQDAP